MADRRTEQVNLAALGALRRAGLIDASAYLDAAYACRDAELWRRWAQRALLALGLGHLLAGIVFFFAYNWDDLPLLARFAALQGGIVVTAAAALAVNIDRWAGQALLIAASVLTGTLLAVIGQGYQTGADAYELFTLWAILIFPWVLASRSAAHWFLWLVIGYTAITLYAYAALLSPVGPLSVAEFCSLLGIGTAVILGVREGAVRYGGAWLDFSWTRIVLVLAALAITFVPAFRYVVDFFGAELIGALTFIGILAVVAYVYVRRLPDFAAVAITTGTFALFLMAVGYRVLDELGLIRLLEDSIVLFFLLLTAWCAALTTGTVKVLAILRRRMADGGGGD